jgi:hypothetical protein
MCAGRATPNSRPPLAVCCACEFSVAVRAFWCAHPHGFHSVEQHLDEHRAGPASERRDRMKIAARRLRHERMGRRTPRQGLALPRAAPVAPECTTATARVGRVPPHLLVFAHGGKHLHAALGLPRPPTPPSPRMAAGAGEADGKDGWNEGDQNHKSCLDGPESAPVVGHAPPPMRQHRSGRWRPSMNRTTQLSRYACVTPLERSHGEDER